VRKSALSLKWPYGSKSKVEPRCVLQAPHLLWKVLVMSVVYTRGLKDDVIFSTCAI